MLADALGPEPADTLLGHLSPVGWADVATKQDRQALRAEFSGELSGLRAEMHDLFRSQACHLMVFFVGSAAVLLAAVTFV